MVRERERKRRPSRGGPLRTRAGPHGTVPLKRLSKLVPLAASDASMFRGGRAVLLHRPVTRCQPGEVDQSGEDARRLAETHSPCRYASSALWERLMARMAETSERVYETGLVGCEHGAPRRALVHLPPSRTRCRFAASDSTEVEYEYPSTSRRAHSTMMMKVKMTKGRPTSEEAPARREGREQQRCSG